MIDELGAFLAGLPPEAPQVAGVWVAALLTLSVLSYIVGRNTFFRLAEYLFVGVAAGYAGSVTWHNALAPRLRLLVYDPAGHWHYLLFTLLGLMLLARGLRSLSAAANLPLAVLVGTGAGLALGGALTGTLVAQMQASLISVSPADYGGGVVGWAYALDAALLVLGTVAVLVSYRFVQSEGRLGTALESVLRPVSAVGRTLILIAFGALLAGALLSFFAILVSRVDFLVRDWLGLFGEMGF